MMTRSILTTCLLGGLLVACATNDADETSGGAGGKADGSGECTDVHYGDGTCQMDLACGIPDIDCYRTFATDAEAASWYAAAFTSEGLPDSDPRFVRTRAVVDKAWTMFKATVPTGRLGDEHLALVLFDDSTPNAYVGFDEETGKVAASIQVMTGLMALPEDDALGVLLHELTHMYGLHALPGVHDKLRRFYVADGNEPIGNRQAEDPRARELGLQWRSLATLVGQYDTEKLGAFPYGGDIERLFRIYLGHVSDRDNRACATAAGEVDAMYGVVSARPLAFDGALPVDDALTAQLSARLDALSSCVAAHQWSFADFLDEAVGHDWDARLDTELSSAEHAWLSADAFTALTNIVATRRAHMRSIEATFETTFSQPWSSLRFFSYEEAADDTSLRVMKAAMHADPDVEFANPGIAGFLLDALPEAERTECERLLDTGAPVPYGVDLLDEHHANCWRIAHARQLLDAP